MVQISQGRCGVTGFLCTSHIYPGHANYLRKVGLAAPNFPTMGDLWGNQDEKMDIENEK